MKFKSESFLNVLRNNVCDVCVMTAFDYKYQNPSDVACLDLALIRAIVIFTALGIQNLNKKTKTNWNVVVVVK